MRLVLAPVILLLLAAVPAPDSGAPTGVPAAGASLAVPRALPAMARVTAADPDGTPSEPRLRCSTDLLHPIEVEVLLVDDMAPGQWLRAVVRVQSRLDLTDVQVHLDPVGAAELAGPRKAAVNAIASGSPYEYTFAVRVPDTASPQQVRVRLSGLAEGKQLERGTVLHLLPRGVQDPGVESPVWSGTQRVLEQRGAARRVP